MRMNYVGWPAFYRLSQFGQTVFDAFGEWPYLVGSATERRDWRDVDVRLLLDDAEYVRLFGERTEPQCLNAKWNAFCVAFTELGMATTRLPVDFQIDTRTWANEHYKGTRIPLSIVGAIKVARADARQQGQAVSHASTNF